MEGGDKKRFFDIVIAKCEEREMQGSDSLGSSDVSAILEQCRRENIAVSREDMQICGLGHLWDERHSWLFRPRTVHGGKAWRL